MRITNSNSHQLRAREANGRVPIICYFILTDTDLPIIYSSIQTTQALLNGLDTKNVLHTMVCIVNWINHY